MAFCRPCHPPSIHVALSQHLDALLLCLGFHLLSADWATVYPPRCFGICVSFCLHWPWCSYLCDRAHSCPLVHWCVLLVLSMLVFLFASVNTCDIICVCGLICVPTLTLECLCYFLRCLSCWEPCFCFSTLKLVLVSSSVSVLSFV